MKETEPKGKSKGFGFYEKDTLKLRDPISVNGAEYKEIPYDFSGLTVDDMLKVDEVRLMSGCHIGLSNMADPIIQFETFCAAVAKADPLITRNDLRRMKYNDGLTAKARTVLFFGGLLEDGAHPNSGETLPNYVTMQELTQADSMA